MDLDREPPNRAPLDPLTTESVEPPVRNDRLYHDSTVFLSYHDHDRVLSGRLPAQTPREFEWKANYRVVRLLGNGAQGVVYLAHRQGVDGYFTRVALKIFYRHEDGEETAYGDEMKRIAGQAQLVSRIQHDNLISIRDFVVIDGNRVMVLEYLDGLDLARLLDRRRLKSLKERLAPESWDHLNDVIVTDGEDHCRLKPGLAVDILRGCLAGLAALHHDNIAHCDLKPSNIMIKRTGTKKIIDIDSSCVLAPQQRAVRGTPYYMAPEQLHERRVELGSDIAALGYVLIEMLTGKQLFRHCKTKKELLEAKLVLPNRLDEVLPDDVLDAPVLAELVLKMVAVDPTERFADADAADLDRVGAVSFHRQLVRANMFTEYDRELAWWLEAMCDAPAAPIPRNP
jgi:serine/threonine-protein kinase